MVTGMTLEVSLIPPMSTARGLDSEVTLSVPVRDTAVLRVV